MGLSLLMVSYYTILVHALCMAIELHQFMYRRRYVDQKDMDHHIHARRTRCRGE